MRPDVGTICVTQMLPCSLQGTNTDNALADSRNAAVLYLAALEFWRVQLLADAIQQHLQ